MKVTNNGFLFFFFLVSFSYTTKAQKRDFLYQEWLKLSEKKVWIRLPWLRLPFVGVKLYEIFLLRQYFIAGRLFLTARKSHCEAEHVRRYLLRR